VGVSGACVFAPVHQPDADLFRIVSHHSSAYEAYDRLSPYYQKFLEGLTAFHSAPFFVEQAKNKGVPVRENRGSPDNKGQHLTNSHPVIRTNPVTGWKGLFVNRGFTKKINELNQDESDHLLEFLFAHIASVSQVEWSSDLMNANEFASPRSEPRPSSQVPMGAQQSRHLGQQERFP
jgi:alpha-ketoglutarate-dependent taurine dioxygenase